ncbi:ATP-binding protein [Pedobacter nyackensis]|uniref:ATP-binding protein n=1 Tax=Pedobacter nyackensis TaxID=475255 RepID=UPI002931C93B|nr:ATP-binding protein [Pedobacter nyackensis]
MAEKVNITSKGIQKVLKNYNEKQAIAEYIWNGFDAHADTIRINYTFNELDSLETLEISDNGYGIDFNRLKQKFDPFYESEKAIQIAAPKHTSKMHGRNGVGRLTFFTFANSATWDTTYKTEKGYHHGSIHIDTKGLNDYTSNFSSPPAQSAVTGTKVSFLNLKISKVDLELSVIPFLINEFCWFIELNKDKNYSILINGTTLNFSGNIKEVEEFDLVYPKTEETFKIKYVHWNEALHKELSKYYFLADGEEIYKDYTTLNKKSDDYFHSVYIESDFFRDFNFKSFENEGQVALFGAAKSSAEYRFLMKELTDYLKGKRKPFLKEYADKLIESYEQDGIFPLYHTEREAKLKKPGLIIVIKALYEIEPKLFGSLNIDQKKTFIRFLNLLLDSNQCENVCDLLNDIVELDEEERNELVAVFESTRLNRLEIH